MKLTNLRFCAKAIAGLAVGAICTFALPAQTQNAIANGDTRTIHLYHTHTGESISATFRVDGQYDRATLAKLNYFLRDWRNDDQTTMNPRLFDVIWETYRESGSRQPIQVVSAYRSPQTNAMLRRRSRAVAEHSQHILGKAMDMHYVDVPMSRVREIAMRLQRGGVGYYPTAGTPFVHLDVGNVRAWPRMSYDQLVRLFPDGKTVHLPPSGHPLARYEEARAEIDARSDRPVMVASAEPQRSGRGFFSRLFGAREADETEDAPVAAPPRGRRQLARVTPTDQDDTASIQTPSERRAADRLARAERNLPRGETTMGSSVATPVAAPVQVAAVSILPPPRPAGLGAPIALAPAPVAIADVPLPPVRPNVLVAVATAEKQVPPLPDLIRQGTEPAVAAMAYAAQPADALTLRATTVPPAEALALRPTSTPPLSPQALQRLLAPRRTQLYAARLDGSNFAMLTQPAALAEVMPQKELGLRPGLRAAVKAEGRALALQGSPLASAQLTAMMADLRIDRFTGATLRPLRTAALSQQLASADLR